MRRHPFQPVTAVLGLAVVAAGVVVAASGVERIEPSVAVAGAAAALGLAVIPWRGRRDDDVAGHDDMT